MDIYDDVDVFDTPRGVQEIPIKADDVDDAKLKSFVAANQTMLKRLMERPTWLSNSTGKSVDDSASTRTFAAVCRAYRHSRANTT